MELEVSKMDVSSSQKPTQKTPKATSLGGWGGIAIALFLFDCAVCSITNMEKHTCIRFVILIVAILEALSDVVQRRGILSSRQHRGQPCHCQTRHEKCMGRNSTHTSLFAIHLFWGYLKLILRHPLYITTSWIMMVVFQHPWRFVFFKVVAEVQSMDQGSSSDPASCRRPAKPVVTSIAWLLGFGRQRLKTRFLTHLFSWCLHWLVSPHVSSKLIWFPASPSYLCSSNTIAHQLWSSKRNISKPPLSHIQDTRRLQWRMISPSFPSWIHRTASSYEKMEVVYEDTPTVFSN